MKLLILILLILYYVDGNSQLVFLDGENMKSRNDKMPNSKLEQKEDVLYLNNEIIHDKSLVPENYSSTFYQIFQNRFLLITFCDIRGISDLMHYGRKDINIIDLDNPDYIYKTKLDSIHIYSDRETMNRFKAYEDFIIYLITSIDEKILTLENKHGESIEIILERIKNPLRKKD